VNIVMITTSEIKISVLVSREQSQAALRAVHSVFELEKPPVQPIVATTLQAPAQPSDAMAVVRRLQGMEDLTIDDVTLDDRQARVTISGVPDAPGVAAQVFEEVAAAGIFVDMIVQSFGAGGQADLSFTVPQTSLTQAKEVADRLTKKFGCKGVTSAPRVAKLSVSGIGMRSHTEVAIRMFRCLAEAGINVEMINTSEVRVNVVVDGAAGQKALACLQGAFQDVRV
jgi:aspartate kinase